MPLSKPLYPPYQPKKEIPMNPPTPAPSAHVGQGSETQRTVAQKIIAARDALVREDLNEAYHQLYCIADPAFSSFTPWANLEMHAEELEHLKAQLAASEARERALREAGNALAKEAFVRGAITAVEHWDKAALLPPSRPPLSA